MTKKRMLSIFTGLSLLALASTSYAALTPKEELGKLIFNDTNLSTPIGQSCASCHNPATGFADPDQFLPTSEGAVAGRFGRKNAPTITYAGLTPDFSISQFDSITATGGQFWDGRALNLFEQAKLPFLNPDELNNPDINTVVTKVCSSTYASLFKQVYGRTACVKKFTATEFATAFNRIAEAITAFETNSEMNKFTSKFDAAQNGTATLTPQENNGFGLFRIQCSGCHTRVGPAFTNFNYKNIGLPKNTGFPFSTMDQTFVDKGLGKITANPLHDGQFKVPNLRNVALTAPYMHNGVLMTLKDVVHFYNTRDVPGVWPAPEVSTNKDMTIGNLGFTSTQEDEVVAFLMTLTDGYVP